MNLSRRWFLAIAGIALSSHLGCGGGNTGPKQPEGPKGVAKAKVSYEGKPITTGTLFLQGEKGFTGGGAVGKDGLFDLRGPNGGEIPVGKYRVAITPPPNAPPGPGATEMPPPPKIEGVPEKFYSTDTSGVEVEIKAGKQDIEIIFQ
jgi:hypothetical protein